MAQTETLITVVRLPSAKDLPLPSYETAGAAGLDLLAALDPNETMTLEPGARAMIPTGLKMAIPTGFEVQVRPRSGLAVKHGVSVLNAPGTIDSDYRGEVKVILINHGSLPFEISRGDRIAQMIVASVARGVWEEAGSLPDTARGTGGFGSTGESGSTDAPGRTKT